MSVRGIVKVICDDSSTIIVQKQPLSMLLISAHSSLVNSVVVVAEVLPVIDRGIGHPPHLVSIFAVIDLLDDLRARGREASSHVYY